MSHRICLGNGIGVPEREISLLSGHIGESAVRISVMTKPQNMNDVSQKC